MAHTKAKGATRLGRDSQAKRLGVKIFGGGSIRPGMIIVRQRGTKFTPGKNVLKGSDDTLYAKISGKVYFTKKKVIGFDGARRGKVFVGIKALSK